ncbi:ATP-dependent DNA helicase RecG [bacterium]|nr:ATP-dependent DNA helicase RecG [bacterium]
MRPSPPANQPWRLPTQALQLERRQNYADRAIVGGLAGLVQQWVDRAAAHIADPGLRDALARLRVEADRYAEMGLPQRKAFVTEVERLGGLVERTATSGVVPLSGAKRSDARERGRGEDAVGPRQGPLRWGSPLLHLPGIGPARAEALARVGLSTVGDLLQYYPFRYEDRREPQPVRLLQHRQSACLLVTVTAEGRVAFKAGQKLALVPATDGSDPISLTWFNQPYRATQFEPGTKLVVTGQVRLHKGEASLAVSEVEIIRDEELNVRRIVPLYSAPPFSQVVMRKLVLAALQACTDYPESRVPGEITERRRLMPLALAYREVHLPTNHETLRAARARLAYDELFLLQVRLAQRRREAKVTVEPSALPTEGVLEELCEALPFALTGAQERVIGEVLDDLCRPEAASRLIHGDVGAGKTVVAAAALLAAVRAGKQGVMMAPTELLAEQHCRTLTELLAPLDVRPVLLTGSLNGAAKRQVQEQIASGQAPLIVGTHAVFQESVQFADLAVAVIDEQHRFGVRQRALLVGKGLRPNVLIMSATPIPRTLALTAYGDFDVSILDELPPGRRPVHTELLTLREERRAFRMVSDVVERGRQAYLVCPIIEADENRRLAAAQDLYERFRRGIFPSLRLALVHGRMDAAEREQTMERFRAGELEALVATTVIEVGVDVPNAICMVIMNAEMFGLAQLHQLRGRVARSHDQAYCLLVTGAKDLDVIERLQVLERTNDGFLVAEEDLRRRGPGEMAGSRQSGLPDLRMADLLADTATLAQAREDAFALVDDDPDLERDEHRELRQWLRERPFGGDWAL